MSWIPLSLSKGRIISKGRTNKTRSLALGCSGFQTELSIVVLEEAERSPTKQRLRRCGNGETKVASRALIFCFFFTCVEELETSREKKVKQK
jgi:hypothetical protein